MSSTPSVDDVAVHASLRVHRPDFTLDVEVSVAAGEVVAVVGPNGAGKSTLLRLLAGLDVPGATSARVTVHGCDWSDRPVEARSIGVSFQDLRLFPHLDVLDNVAFPLRARGVVASRARHAAERELASVDVDPSLHARRPATLSGGEAQRVALARALVAEPELLLLDEPFAAVDAEYRGVARAALLRRLARFPGVALVVTHDAADALLLGDRVLVLEAGRAVQLATPHEVARRPASRFAAELVGTNLLAGRVEGGSVSTVGGTPIVLADERDDGDVALIVPPSAVALHRRAPSGTPRNVWEADVVAVELVGGRARVVLDLGSGDELVAEVTLPAVDELGIAAGEHLWASVKATEISTVGGRFEPDAGTRMRGRADGRS